MQRKWRPSLPMIVAVIVAVALLLPLSGILLFRLVENHLVRATEAELIAQSAALSAVMESWLEGQNVDALPLGRSVPPPSLPEGENWAPTFPKLDLTTAPILPDRPDAHTTSLVTPDVYMRAGAFLTPILQKTQQATLAGFRVLDFSGIVIAGRNDHWLSMAHIPEVAAALEGRFESVVRERKVDNPQPIYSISRGTRVRVFTATPVIIGDRVAGVIYASRTPSNIIKELYALRTQLGLIALGILASVAIILTIFTRSISSPIRALASRAQRIGQGERAAIGVLPHYGSREVHGLAQQLMAMAQKLFDRIDYINTFANHVSHELKSPFTSIRGAVELLEDQTMDDAERTKFLQNIAKDAERGTALLDQLRALAKAENAIITSGTSMLTNVVSAARSRFPDLDIEVENDDSIPIPEPDLQIVLDNLLDNASSHGASWVGLSSERVDDRVFVTIADNGTGISSDNADKIFEMFFTTRRASGGTGVGLTIASSILKAHKGHMTLEPSQKGACFRLSLPTLVD